MLATFCYLGLLLVGAVTALLALLIVYPHPPGEDGARLVDGLAVGLGALAGMIASARVARVLLTRVGGVSSSEAHALTRERRG